MSFCTDGEDAVSALQRAKDPSELRANATGHEQESTVRGVDHIRCARRAGQIMLTRVARFVRVTGAIVGGRQPFNRPLVRGASRCRWRWWWLSSEAMRWCASETTLSSEAGGGVR
jgi:hypothetical protein